MQAEPQAKKNATPWFVAIAVVLVLAIFIYNRVAAPPSGSIVTSGAEYQDKLRQAEKLSMQHLQDIDNGKELDDAAIQDLRQAAVLFDAMADFQPTNIAPYMGAGKCYQALGNDEAAIRRFEQGLATVPKDPIPAVRDTQIETFYLLSKSQFTLGKDLPAAMKSINEAIALYPRSPIYMTQRARIYIQEKQYREASHDLITAIQIDPQYKLAESLLKLIAISASEHYTQSAKTKLNGKDYKGVVADCDEGLKVARGYAPLLVLRAAANIELGQKDKAKADVTEVLMAHPDNVDALKLQKLLK